MVGHNKTAVRPAALNDEFRPGGVPVEKRDPMKECTDRIVAQLEIGVKPYIRPWDPFEGHPRSPDRSTVWHSGI
jgi:antirestriction protein ArdC